MVWRMMSRVVRVVVHWCRNGGVCGGRRGVVVIVHASVGVGMIVCV